MHASADHAVVTRLTPAGPHRTMIRVQWLVEPRCRRAITNFGRLVPFWRLTSEQDWSLCERNHSGVCNPAFTPGPYSPEREYNVAAFDAWYLRRLTG